MGGHLRRRRLELRLTQRAAAEKFGVTRDAYAMWEGGSRNLEPSHTRMALEFLGYDPIPRPAAFSAFVRWARYRLGLEQAEFARVIDVPLPTLRGWEGRLYEPPKARKDLLEITIQSLIPIWEAEGKQPY